MKRRLPTPSPALVIALVALFIALGGTSYAAVTLPKNSVGAKQLKKNAVTGVKIKNGAVTAGKINPAGLTVPTATHAGSADSATSATSATNSSQLGGVAAAHYMRPGATLASGDTETGVYGATAPSGSLGLAEISFEPKLGAAPATSEYITTTPSSTCPGPGQAAAGHLCLYQGWIFGMTFSAACSPNDACNGSPTANGASVYFDSTDAQGNTSGNWAYKAP